MMAVSVVVDRAVAEVEQGLQERVGMRLGGAGPHLNGQEEERGQNQEARETRAPASPEAAGERGSLVVTSPNWQ